jgi:hypothetical protein
MSDGWGAYAVFVILAAGGAFNQYRILREKKKK